MDDKLKVSVMINGVPEDETVVIGSKEVEQCHACDFETECEWYIGIPFGPGSGAPNDAYPKHGAMLLCSLCAGTFAGNAAKYPNQYDGSGSVLHAICHVGNAILKRIDALEKKLEKS